MDKKFHPTLCWGCDYLSMLGLNLNYASKGSPMIWQDHQNKAKQRRVYVLWNILYKSKAYQMVWQNCEKEMIEKNMSFFNCDVLCSIIMSDFYPTGIINEYPKSCYGVHDNGYNTIDPEQDGVDPITVFCNTSSSPVTALLHHNLEDWTLVSGYESPGSYDARVGSE